MRSINILLTVRESGEGGVGDVDYACVPLDVATISEILKQMQELSGREDVQSYQTFDYSPVWLAVDERQLWKTLRKGASEDADKVDCEERRIWRDAVEWSAYYKHTDVTLRTNLVYRKTLEKLLAFCKGKKDEDQLDFDEDEANTLNLKLIKELDDEFGKKS